MTVDIIIPTYKPDETLCLLLHKLQGQTFVVHRVIILNTEEKLWKQAAAAYPIEQVLKELPCEYEVFHIAKKDFDHGGTRQFGAEHSDADVMVFMTQDAVPADEFLVEKLVESLLLKEDQVSARVQQNAMEVTGTEKSAVKDCLVAAAYASFRKVTAILSSSIRGSLIIPNKAVLRQRQIFRHLGSKRFSVQMSVRHIAGIYLKNWGDLSLRLFLMRICFLQQMLSNTDMALRMQQKQR